MACIFFTISSGKLGSISAALSCPGSFPEQRLVIEPSGKLDIFMVLHVTQIWDKLEAIWLFQAQAIDPPSWSYEITW